jgi:hypothetical protein
VYIYILANLIAFPGLRKAVCPLAFSGASPPGMLSPFFEVYSTHPPIYEAMIYE